MLDVESESAWEILAENVLELAGRGESSLVFVKSKHETRRGAQLLSQRMTSDAADKAISELRALEPTCSRNALIETLQNGVAFPSWITGLWDSKGKN